MASCWCLVDCWLIVVCCCVLLCVVVCCCVLLCVVVCCCVSCGCVRGACDLCVRLCVRLCVVVCVVCVFCFFFFNMSKFGLESLQKCVACRFSLLLGGTIRTLFGSVNKNKVGSPPVH
jgi:hypothetical protein